MKVIIELTKDQCEQKLTDINDFVLIAFRISEKADVPVSFKWNGKEYFVTVKSGEVKANG